MEMNRDSAMLLAQNPQVVKRSAEYMAQQSFRNTIREDFHAGITPYSKAGGYSDASVRTPAGEIPWSILSRLSDEEMKKLMSDVDNRTYLLLQMLFDKTGRSAKAIVSPKRFCSEVFRNWRHQPRSSNGGTVFDRFRS